MLKFCIVGTGRSGTTLLWQMMNGHPDLFVHRETHWIPTLHEHYGTCRVATAAMLDIVARTRHVTGHPTTDLDADAFRAWRDYRAEMTVREFCDALGSFCAHRDGKTLWADKTPDYGFFTSTLQLYWPDCKIIHIIRDGADAACSMSRHIGFQGLAATGLVHWCHAALDYRPPPDGFAAQPMRTFVDLWYYRLLRTLDEAGRLAPGSYLEIRYEDMIRDPGPWLYRIARFTGLAEDPAWLREAEKLIDLSRGGRRSERNDVLKHFDTPRLELMRRLGYSVAAV